MNDSIIIIEDDIHVRKLLEMISRFVCKDVTSFGSAEEFLSKHKTFSASLYLVDHHLPGMFGDELIKLIKSSEPLAIIYMISNHDEKNHVKNVLESGADQFIKKPFAYDILESQLMSGLQRARLTYKSNFQKGMKFIPEASMISMNGTIRVFSEREYKLLEYLFINRSQVSSRQDLLPILGPNCDHRNVDVMMSGLRKKIHGLDVEIRSIRGSGYKLISS